MQYSAAAKGQKCVCLKVHDRSIQSTTRLVLIFKPREHIQRGASIFLIRVFIFNAAREIYKKTIGVPLPKRLKSLSGLACATMALDFARSTGEQ